MMPLPPGTPVRYREIDRFGRPTRRRLPGRTTGVVIGRRDNRGALVRWSDGFVGSVLWDWIEPASP
jgi:hypothetical protein